MTFKSFSYITLFVLSIQASSSLFAIELFSFSSDDDGVKVNVLTVAVHDEKKIKQEALDTIALQEESKRLDLEIPKIQKQLDEATDRVARKKQELRRKLREYQCSQK